jgi:Na+-translocating ferredoxin:NAD+ oxidoreductase RnfE subunit
MDWDTTLLGVHLSVFVMLCVIFKRAPGFAQKLVIGLLMAGVAVMSWAYGAAVIFDVQCREIIQLGHVIEHLAVLLYVIRIFINDQEKRCLPNFSQQSRHLLD